MPRAPNHWGAENFQQCRKYATFFNTVHLLPKNLQFEHGAAKLVSYPGRHKTSVRPCLCHIGMMKDQGRAEV